ILKLALIRKLQDVNCVIMGIFDLSSYYTITVNPSLLEELGYFPTDIQKGLINDRILRRSAAIPKAYRHIYPISTTDRMREKPCGCHSRPQSTQRYNDPECNRSGVTSFGVLPRHRFLRTSVGSRTLVIVPGGPRESIVCRDALSNDLHVLR
ncbi:hypothetical protein EAG_00606, partial [Camponotus floridanus]